MKIGGLQKTTLIDYPGKIACTIFFSGCNFRCPFCYSKELVIPEEIAKHPQIEEKELFDFLLKRKDDLEGVVLCGGEPTLNPDLPDFCSRIKELGYDIKLDTNGYNPEMLDRLKGLIDYIAMDIKAPLDKEKYSLATGVDIDIQRIYDSIKKIKDMGVGYEFRTTVVLGIHSKEDIVRIAKDISPADKFFLQKFLSDKEVINPEIATGEWSWEDLSEVVKEIEGYFKICKLR